MVIRVRREETKERKGNEIGGGKERGSGNKKGI